MVVNLYKCYCHLTTAHRGSHRLGYDRDVTSGDIVAQLSMIEREIVPKRL